MGLKSYKPVTPGTRQLKNIDRSELWNGSPFKTLTVKKSAKAGRNNYGHITVRRRQGGHKKQYRIIDFKRNRFDVSAVVERIEYDPNRTAFIALIKYEDGQFSYILAPQKLQSGDKIVSSKSFVDVKEGNAMPLSVIPIGTIVHNVESKPGKGGSVARTAGGYVQLVSKNDGYALLKLQSGEIKMFLLDCMATVGAVSNPDNKNKKLGKAGRARWMGNRPSVRGEVMNPVDHPHGGRTRGGRNPVSPTGKCAKGGRTRNKKAASNRLIVHSRHKNKK